MSPFADVALPLVSGLKEPGEWLRPQDCNCPPGGQAVCAERLCPRCPIPPPKPATK